MNATQRIRILDVLPYDQAIEFAAAATDDERIDIVVKALSMTRRDPIWDQTCGCDQETAFKNGSPW